MSESLEELRKGINAKERDKNRVIGKRDHLMEQLKSLGYDSVEDAEAAIAKKGKKLKSMGSKLNKKVAAFKKKYKNFLG